ncbi:SsgA family sporulation/cell division regulator [Streptomyces sp. NPDC046685]|uniref:SsgA family sporulation/cell division regulator n=1 Tax=Streptomyces sp. NPDC046685 TaxID=3157202 RepID=UPI0033C895B4
MSCATAPIVVRLDSARGRVPLLARFSYDDGDPYVVRATFYDGPTVLARWHFDRQMLTEGLHHPVGEGDVTFAPHRADGADEVRIALRGPGAAGQEGAVLFVETRALTRFLEQTYAVTAAGEEFLDLDRLLDEFLAR